MNDGLYQVTYGTICAGFEIANGALGVCAPVLRKRIEFFKTIAKRVDHERVSERDDLKRLCRVGNVIWPGHKWNVRGICERCGIVLATLQCQSQGSENTTSSGEGDVVRNDPAVGASEFRLTP